MRDTLNLVRGAVSTKVFIYGLLDPRTETIRYVGKAQDPYTRLKYHLVPSSLAKPCHRAHWLVELMNGGLRPSIIILEEVSITAWEKAERYWIEQFSNLTNGTRGGEGGATRLGQSHTEEAKRKIGAANKGNNHGKGNELTLAHKAAISASKIGNTHGKNQSLAVRDKKRLRMLGNTQTLGRSVPAEEALRRAATLRRAYAEGRAVPHQRGKPRTLEERAKISAALKGRPKSEKTRERMRAAQRRRFERSSTTD